ncbi:MAG: vWA domain-containing protein [Oryzihumus sp.]
MSADPELAADRVLVGFATALRHAGVGVTSDRTQTFLRACAQVGAGEPQAVYWAGRATLCAGPDDLRRYDAVFSAFFAGSLRPGGTPAAASVPRRASLEDPGDTGAQPDAEEDVTVRAMASRAEVLRHRDMAELDAAERAMLARLFATLRPQLPRRRGTRHRPAPRGPIDARRTMREELRRAGEPGRIRRRRRATRPRRVVLLVDVSGSMAPYADSVLRLAHTLVQVQPRSVEVFTVGTRLTRVTRALRERDPGAALRLAGETVPDWSGGTRLGEVLKVFCDRWGQRGLARGAVVVVCSDGWERGDCSLLADQMHRLSRLSHRVVWMNPHRGKAGYEPVQAGMAAALPYVDDFVAGHSLATFATLIEVVADA